MDDPKRFGNLCHWGRAFGLRARLLIPCHAQAGRGVGFLFVYQVEEYRARGQERGRQAVPVVRQHVAAAMLADGQQEMGRIEPRVLAGHGAQGLQVLLRHAGRVLQELVQSFAVHVA